MEKRKIPMQLTFSGFLISVFSHNHQHVLPVLHHMNGVTDWLRAAQNCSTLIFNPFLKFVRTPNYLLDPAFKCNIVHLCFSLFSIHLSFEQSFAFSIGRPILSADICVACKAAALDTLFLFACKVPAIFMKLSKVTIDISTSFGLITVIFGWHFSLNLTLRLIIGFYFSEEPQLSCSICNCIRGMVVLKVFTDSTSKQARLLAR